MRFWLVHSGAVSLREQIVTQVSLGILSGELAPEERLPSIRELARRFQLHPNTISAGYRALEQGGWVEFHHGSGVYVRSTRPQTALTPGATLDSLIQNLLRTTRALGLSQSILPQRLHHWMNLQPPDHFLFIEPDQELRQIVTLELRQALTLPVLSCDFDECTRPTHLTGAIPLALPSKVEAVRKLLQPQLPAGIEVVPLRVRSIPTSMAEWLPAPTDALVGIASRWPEFLHFARTMLVAAGFLPDSLVVRDARQTGWRRGLAQTTGVVCDLLTAQSFGNKPLAGKARTIPFPLLADDGLEQLRQSQPDPPTAAAPPSVAPPRAPRSAARRKPPPPPRA